MQKITRRSFIVATGATAAGLALTAACGDDGGDDASPTPSASAAATATVSAGADNGAASLRWYGHAMFLLTSPAGISALIDPYVDIGYGLPQPIDATVTTISHEHPDHNNDALSSTGDRVLRGLTADGWATVDETAADLRIRSVGAYHDDQQGAARGRNAIFVYETAGIRIAHLGDLGHQLDAAQLAALGGPVDVLMVPVGGTFTIDPAGATELVAALKPTLVFPIHYKTDRAGGALSPVDPFLQGKTVQRIGSTTARLSKDALPAEQTVMVLDYA